MQQYVVQGEAFPTEHDLKYIPETRAENDAHLVEVKTGTTLWKGISREGEPAVRKLIAEGSPLADELGGYYASSEIARIYGTTSRHQTLDIEITTTQPLRLIDLSDLNTLNMLLHLIQEATVTDILCDPRYAFLKTYMKTSTKSFWTASQSDIENSSATENDPEFEERIAVRMYTERATLEFNRQRAQVHEAGTEPLETTIKSLCIRYQRRDLQVLRAKHISTVWKCCARNDDAQDTFLEKTHGFDYIHTLQSTSRVSFLMDDAKMEFLFAEFFRHFIEFDGWIYFGADEDEERKRIRPGLANRSSRSSVRNEFHSEIYVLPVSRNKLEFTRFRNADAAAISVR